MGGLSVLEITVEGDLAERGDREGAVDQGVSTMPWRRKLPPIHPGELLQDELNEIGVDLTELSRALGVPATRIGAIVSGKEAITAEAAARLAHYFGTSPQYWLNLQDAFDSETAAAC